MSKLSDTRLFSGTIWSCTLFASSNGQSLLFGRFSLGGLFNLLALPDVSVKAIEGDVMTVKGGF